MDTGSQSSLPSPSSLHLIQGVENAHVKVTELPIVSTHFFNKDLLYSQLYNIYANHPMGSGVANMSKTPRPYTLNKSILLSPTFIVVVSVLVVVDFFFETESYRVAQDGFKFIIPLLQQPPPTGCSDYRSMPRFLILWSLDWTKKMIWVREYWQFWDFLFQSTLYEEWLQIRRAHGDQQCLGTCWVGLEKGMNTSAGIKWCLILWLTHPSRSTHFPTQANEECPHK